MKALITSALLFIVVFLNSGCQYAGLTRDVDLLNQSTLITGMVVAKDTNSPIVVTLNRVEGDVIELEQYVTVLANNEFHFSVPDGDFYLFAFEDKNQNFTLDFDEGIAFYGSPSLLTVNKQRTTEEISLNLLSQSKSKAVLPELYQSDNQHQPIDHLHNYIGKVVQPAYFNEGIGKQGMWEPVKFHEAGHTGVFFLEPYSNEKIPVLFVHGMSGSGYDWKNLIATLDRDIYQPWVVQYPSGIDLDLAAKMLYQSVSELTVMFDTESIIIVAHSMGGLVSKKALAYEFTADKPQLNVAAFITISTPWAGHDSAAKGIKYMPVAVPSWFDMAPESEFINSINALSLKEHLPHYLFFGYRDGGRLISSQNTDGVVSLKSQLAPSAQDGATAVYGFDENHTSILSNPNLAKRIEEIIKATQ